MVAKWNSNLHSFSLEHTRPRRQAPVEIADFLARMSVENPDSNITNISNQLNNSFSTTDLFPNTTIDTTTTTSTEKAILKPSVVETDKLSKSSVTKPPTDSDPSKVQTPCMKFFCCYHQNETNLNGTISENSFSCQEKEEKPSDNCTSILQSCLNSPSKVCLIDKTSIRCRIDQICGNEKKPDCSISLIETAINASLSTTTTTMSTTTTTDTPSTTVTTTTTESSSTTTITTTTSMY